MLAFLLSLTVAHALTFEPTKAELKCGPGVYCVEKMFCLGHVVNPPKGMHPDYFVSLTTFRSLKSAKNLGGGKKTLVDALVIGEDYAGSTPNITFAEAWAKADFEGGSWYRAPARVSGDNVLIDGGGFDQGYEFKIVSSEQKDGYRLDRLVGAMATIGSVVPDYQTQYECQAEVVDQPSRVDDFTRP